MMKRKLLYYTGLLLFLAAAAAAVWLAGRRVRLPYADEMEEAARLHSRVVEAVRTERLARGYALAPEDTLGLGLIGEESTAITTSLGSLESKRTAQLPEMAALMVRLFREAGVKKGDTVGACFSASFPGADLAVLCAADVMGLKIVYSAAVGSSTYGANLPGYVLPEMIKTCVDAGLLSAGPQMVSLGGDSDEGGNMFGVLMGETEEIETMKKRLAEEGIELLHFERFEENVRFRMEKMGEIKAFVNVGGNILGIGSSDAALSFGQGLLKPAHPALNEKSGLMERYLNLDVPVIHILNLKQLCAESGAAFDPVSLPEIGTGGVYYSRRYSKPLIAAAALIGTAAALLIEKDEQKRRRAAKQ